MSFDVNVLRTKPIIRETANMNNDGGGGNLGYMQQERDEDRKQKRLDESIFGQKEEDIFIGKENLNYVEEGFSIVKWVSDILEKFLKILTSFTNP